MKQVTLSFALALILMLVTEGCRTYGSRMVTVTLKTSPEKHADVFLLSLNEWNRVTQGKTWLQPYVPTNPSSFQELMEPYHITGQRTPLHIQSQPYVFVYVAQFQGRYVWETVNFASQKNFCVELR